MYKKARHCGTVAVSSSREKVAFRNQECEYIYIYIYIYIWKFSYSVEIKIMFSFFAD